MRLTPEQKQMVEDNIGLAYYAANKFNKTFTWLEYEEILATCFLALTKAAKGYDPKQAKFSTYAMTAMYREAKRELIEKNQQAPVYYLEDITNADGEKGTWQEIFTDGKSTEDEMLNKVITDQLPEIIDSLKIGKTYKACLKLHIEEPSLTQTEVANRIDCKQKTVSLAYSIAKEKLRPLICAV